jgi:progressive ankylosis protein
MNNPELSQKKILKFWIPLAATWLMMSFEGPYLAALIARLAEPEYNLAAYGIAFSLALIVEAPIIMMMSASTALVKDYAAYKQLRKFNFTLSAALTLGIILLILPPVFYYITETLIGLPEKISHLAHYAVIILIPWPAAIGYRRFYQGILIRNNLTRLVAYGTVIRLVSMSLTAFGLYNFTALPGVVVGSASLSTAVLCEAAASRLMSVKIIKRLKSLPSEPVVISQKDIFKFYYPLALTSLLILGIQPFVTFFIGQSRMSIESFAVLPVVTSFVFIFRALGLSFQEVVITLIGDDYTGLSELKRFALKLAGYTSGVLIIIAFTPLSEIWLRDISGLSEELTSFARLPLMIMSVFPAFTVLISFQRAVLVKANQTKQITYGTAVEFIGIFIVVAVCIKVFSLVGAVAATISFLTGRIAACGYLMPPVSASLKKNQTIKTAIPDNTENTQV